MKNKNIIKIKLILLILLFNTNIITSAQEIINPEETEIWEPTPLIIDTFNRSIPSDANNTF